MKFRLGQADWQSLAQGESHSFLLTNGLGGYCSQTVIASCARHDHNLLTAAVTAPSKRFAMVRRTDEILHVNGKCFGLDSQAYVTGSEDRHGYRYLNRFTLDGLPFWEYMAEGVRVQKRLVLVYGTNSLAVSYRILADPGVDAWLEVVPVYGFHSKNDRPTEAFPISCRRQESFWVLEGGGEKLYLLTDGELTGECEQFIRWYRYDQDGPDGRDGWGGGRKLHRICSVHTGKEESVSLNLIYGMDRQWMQEQAADVSVLSAAVCRLCEAEKKRQQAVEERSKRKGEAARQLAVSAQAHLTRRDSTDGMSIIAGFPFFGDWGRDTMIAFYGCTLAVGETEAAKSILRTFMRYCRRGIMPNLFPEGRDEVLYNTADASLLFINALWDYLKCCPDPDFAAEALPVAESIISWYAAGTDYHIHMEEDGLLAAGNGLWQLTWMDVRFGDILPTPRHGKPVEINAYWYNAVCVLRELFLQQEQGKIARTISLQAPQLTAGWEGFSPEEKAGWLDGLAARIRTSFLTAFTRPDGTLYDVLPEKGEPDAASRQVRCNAVFALTMPFTMVEKPQADRILAQIRRELYTPVGLRSLSVYDPQFHPHYGGSQFERDMAYHQGTVWAYPLGAYYRACLRFAADQRKAAGEILEQLEAVEASLAEGCLGQLAEIYDGEAPGASRGCFAQAWSVAELLRAYEEAEEVYGGEV